MDAQTPLPTADNEFLDQVRIPALVVIAGLAVAGGVIGIAGGTPESISATLPVALLVFLLAAVAWLLARWRRAAGVWAVLGGLTVTVLLLRVWLQLDGALVLLAIPATFGPILLGHRAGATLPWVCTLLAAWLWAAGVAPPLELALALTVIWLVFLVYWFMVRSVMQLVDWSWTHYQDAQQALTLWGMFGLSFQTHYIVSNPLQITFITI